MNETYKCLDCLAVVSLDVHGKCARCGSQGVILRGISQIAQDSQPRHRRKCVDVHEHAGITG